MIMVSIALVMSVVVTNLYLRKDGRKRVPFCVRKLFLPRPEDAKKGGDHNHQPPALVTPPINLLHSQLHVDPCSSRRYSVTENHVSDNMVKRNCTSSSPVTVNHQEADQLSLKSITFDGDGRPMSSSLGARLASPTTCCRPLSGGHLRRAGSPVYRSHSHGRVPDIAVAAATVLAAETDSEQWSLEWQILAKRVDRVFFWLFLLTSGMALSTIFISIPRYASI